MQTKQCDKAERKIEITSPDSGSTQLVSATYEHLSAAAEIEIHPESN